MKTITHTTPRSFNDALMKLVAGDCIGIKPGRNTNYAVLYKPQWMNKNSLEYMLVWRGTENSNIRTDQFLSMWYLVTVDYRSFVVVKHS